MAACDEPGPRSVPLIRAYAAAARLYGPAAGPAFAYLRTALTERTLHLPPAELTTLLRLTINHGLRRANAGDQAALADTLALYRYGLAAGLLHERGQLSVFSFNNILGLALHLEQTDFARAFLDRYHADLPAERGPEVLALARARLARAAGDDGAALHHLQQADFTDFIHHLTARVLQLKIYFDRPDQHTLLSSHVSSTRRLLARRRGGSYHLRNYRNIFALAHALLRLDPHDPAARARLRARIETTEPCTERGWLVRQLGC